MQCQYCGSLKAFPHKGFCLVLIEGAKEIWEPRTSNYPQEIK